MKAASIVNEAYCIILIETIKNEKFSINSKKSMNFTTL